MPLLGNGEYREPVLNDSAPVAKNTAPKDGASVRRQSQHSIVAKAAIMSQLAEGKRTLEKKDEEAVKDSIRSITGAPNGSPSTIQNGNKSGAALSDTPVTTAPNSPIIPPRRQDSGSTTPVRPRAATTLDIPGLTKSRVSPDGKIAQRDIGSKLVIVMVGLPARGKSYVTKKIARYLNWLQHDTKIFNVGERRRVAAHSSSDRATDQAPNQASRNVPTATASPHGMLNEKNVLTPPSTPSTRILLNGRSPPATPPLERLPPAALDISKDGPPGEEETNGRHDGSVNEKETPEDQKGRPRVNTMEQTANFFDPTNEKASSVRQQLAMDTLDELLDYILEEGGSVGIFDATNSTLERRKSIIEKVRQRAGPDLGILFLESLCVDENLLESNMRLKLSGPDYRDQDSVVALEDFKKRVALYEKKYVPLGDYEEKNNMSFVQMIDVGRKIITHQIRGFLSAQTVYYLLNFNLAPRRIFITRHGESTDNLKGRIGGDSDLSEAGRAYAETLTRFIRYQRDDWDDYQQKKALNTHFPPQPGDTTPPNPEYGHGGSDEEPLNKNFCVWTSMLKRSIQTAQYFNDEEFDIKQMKMLDELNAGIMEGLTYEEIKSNHAAEYALRKQDKLHYRYPGSGGEGYLDVINRLRAVIVEVERMTDHVLLIGHRSVARVLLAYFKGLKREDVADLDMPLGMLYMLEPKPYGVEFKAYRYHPEREWFSHVPDYELRPTMNSHA